MDMTRIIRTALMSAPFARRKRTSPTPSFERPVKASHMKDDEEGTPPLPSPNAVSYRLKLRDANDNESNLDPAISDTHVDRK
ncbi:hypothetical protein FPSE_08268 [Fusarium pseudograminearum CS3096]|uniref:Uncharacterized protein n=1 Tax=Fusarium pseudograminearum (strain CS3096) TaxID=1028729 RepID=K3VCA2_FUSPC|nr:hypothetical protein FPSE_08268 [Fusarium pseudograminearum CS3096]EKJ71527.1 hypothetical protein FPSE_08268 [Fusarium pseudograminearum CS3096]